VGRRFPAGHHLTLISHHHTAVQSFLYFHPGMGVAGPLRSRQELQGVFPQLHRVVLGHGALVLEAQHSFQKAAQLRWPVG
jgi:hypothetical protein